jgi:glycosyltransferase involved in cell wall biosynthesis
VTNGSNGFVCDTEADMITAINNIGSINRATCRQVAEQKFSATVLAKQYEELYQRATGKN